MLVTASQMREHEEAVIRSGTPAAALMQLAAEGIAQLVRSFFPSPGSVVAYCGKGNNAGDALAVAHLLRQSGWDVAVRLSGPATQLAELPARYLQLLGDVPRDEPPVHRGGALVLLDGLLGIGARGPLNGSLLRLAAEMNTLRQRAQAVTVAIDIPSGVDPDSGLVSEGAVVADITATIAHAKQGLVADSATDHVGRIAVIPVAGLGLEPSGDQLLTADLLRPMLPSRHFDMHKGQAGRLHLFAGSQRYPGAAILCSLGALAGGAGLITLHTDASALGLIAPRLPPEIMLSSSLEDLADADAFAIGPGMEANFCQQALQAIQSLGRPTVLDAEAIGKTIPGGPCLFTPHPGEMARLAPQSRHLSRREQATAFAAEHPGSTILLKGSRSVIATQGQPLRYNTTGHPGMACGGMGDVLTGLTAALLAQGVSTHDAASLGSWLLGRAAELALKDGMHSPESLTASIVAGHLGRAFNALRNE